MINQNDFRILADGLSLFPTKFKNVEYDLTPVEKKLQTNGFQFKAEPDELNSAETYNNEQRKKYNVISYDFEEFLQVYTTRNFKFYKMRLCIDVIKYLYAVLDLAEFINNGITKAIKSSKEIRENRKLDKDDARYQILKNTVNDYLDILIEIKTKKDDFINSKYSHYFEQSYEELDNYSRIIITSHAIPDEMTVSFNSLYEGIPLNKFSSQKELKVSKEMCMASFSQLSDKIYMILHIFLSNLIKEFSPYITSDAFLNNPEKKTLFVVPLSLYKKFNFQKSGLTRQETIFIDSEDHEKTAANYSSFFKDVKEGLDDFYNQADQLRKKLSSEKDDKQIEWLFDSFTKRFNQTTFGQINKLQEKCKENPGFREKITNLMFEGRKEIVEMVTANGDPWSGVYEEKEVTTDLKNSDKDVCHFLWEICRGYFGETGIPCTQLQRFFHLFCYQTQPIKGISTYMKKFGTKEVKWASSRKDQLLKILYR